MHIEALFTPAQRVLVAHLHSRDQEERRASSTDTRYASRRSAQR